MEQLVRLGALARVDPDPADEIAAWEADLELGRIDDPEETRRRLEAYARGDQVIVRLDMFADVLREEHIERYDGTRVRGAWFEAGPDAVSANVAHARELVTAHLDAFYGHLRSDRGVDLAYDQFCVTPLVIEIDEALAQRLG